MNNAVVITGNVSTEPEMSYTPGGKAVVKFNVAVNSGSGESKRLDGYFPVTAWRELAEHVAETIHMGTRVVVTGRLSQDRWENDGGQKRSKIFITATEVSPSLLFATATVSRAGAAEAPSPDQTPDE